MDNLGIGISPPPIVIRATSSDVQSTPMAAPEVSFLPLGGSSAASFDPQAAEQQRLQTVQSAAQSVADSFVVSDHTFTIFKDSTGQYITRFTSLRDGSVTYIPEPNLIKLSGQTNRASVTINA